MTDSVLSPSSPIGSVVYAFLSPHFLVKTFLTLSYAFRDEIGIIRLCEGRSAVASGSDLWSTAMGEAPQFACLRNLERLGVGRGQIDKN